MSTINRASFLKALSVFLLGLTAILSYPSISIGDEGSTSGPLSNYKLGGGDKVHILVYGEQELSLDAQLSDAGTILYPFLGEIKASGLTVGQLAELIANGLKGRYLVEPKVSVGIAEYRPFYINGEVKNPGAYPYQPGLTVQKAVSIAGGFSPRASRSSVIIARDKDPSHSPQEAELDATVSPGDVITVEESFF